jgi:hypothetical protein
MDELAEISRKHRKKRRKRKKKKKRPVGLPTSPAPQPPTPPGPTKHKHIVGWTDPGDGLVREVVEWRDQPQPAAEIPPRPLPSPLASTSPASPQPMGTYSGPFGRVQAKRLLDRAGFGARPGQAAQVAEMGMQSAVRMLTRPSGTGELHGPAPTTAAHWPRETRGATTTSGGWTG